MKSSKVRKELDEKDNFSSDLCEFSPPAKGRCLKVIVDKDCPAKEKSKNGNVYCFYVYGKAVDLVACV